MAKRIKTWYIYLLAIQTALICTLSIKLWQTPNVVYQTLDRDYYDKITIETWHNISQKSLISDEIENVVPGNFQGGTEQVFTQQDQILTLKLATFSKSNGDLKKYLKNFSENLFSIAQHSPEVGDYSIYMANKSLVMTACLVDSGQATITADQFKIAQILAAFKIKQLWHWLTNQNQLIPHTCHWRSLRLSPVTPDAKKTLVNIWLTLNQTTPL